MAKTTPFTIGADASCTDGACGKMTRVVVDPIARAITHLGGLHLTGLTWPGGRRSRWSLAGRAHPTGVPGPVHDLANSG